ncbi:MAG: bifunctional oligoribonuclease/PAP phosphatase NrnA [Solirubrobacteraceae bacterium]|nr:bifunctional oligoribonuclease/PAP phosphatase NrnA [Patulibacter sp.]
MTPSRTAAEAVFSALRDAGRVILATHTHPDGDAIGSLVAMRLVLERIGISSRVFIAAQDLPLPEELATYDLGEVVHEDTVDVRGRTVVFLDCGNADRTPLGEWLPEIPVLVNIDHHHDNTRFGTINLIDPTASSTAEMVWELAQMLGVPITTDIAEPLYVGLLTDTGRFSYENTTPRAHAMAADLIAAGVDLTGVRRRLYEDVRPAKLHLLRAALESMAIHGDGLLVSARVTEEDFRGAQATEAHAEGIIDVLRVVRGVRIAALARELDVQPGTFKVSLRAADPTVDVSAIARASGGGGHPQAAGFTTQLGDADLADFILGQLREQDAGGAAA